MITETIYTSIGAAALAVDFVTSPAKQQNWLKKAERRGSRLAQNGQKALRPVRKQIESTVADARANGLSLLGLAQESTEKAEKSVRRTATTARKRAPRARVTRRRRTSRGRKVQATTLTLQQPVSAAS